MFYKRKHPWTTVLVSLFKRVILMFEIHPHRHKFTNFSDKAVKHLIGKLILSRFKLQKQNTLHNIHNANFYSEVFNSFMTEAVII